MYRVTKRLEISSAHKLNLPYSSHCGVLHGHNWIVEVTCESETLDENGMVLDFTEIKKAVSLFDHRDLNEILPQPTAENLARAICEAVPKCVAVLVRESEGNTACYMK